MKRVFLLLGALWTISCAPAFARQAITFDADDFDPAIGSLRDAETYRASPTLGTPDHADLQLLGDQNGPGQVFDLTTFAYDPAPTTFTNTFKAFDPADPNDPGAGVQAFQGATYVLAAPRALNPGSPGDFYGYYSVSANSLSFHGSVTSIPQGNSTNTNVPAELIYTFPLQFGDVVVSNHVQTAQTPVGVFVSDVRVTREVDGWGTLITPAGMADCLRIVETRDILNNGVVVASGLSVHFITKEGISGFMGFDQAFQMWGSVSYTVDTVSGGGGDDDDDDDDGTGGVLLVVDDDANPGPADTAVDNLLEGMGLAVMIVSDQDAVTSDANDKDLVVVSATIDPAVLAADWSATNVPLVTWDHETYARLLMTGVSDFGTTAATTQLTLLDAAHPIANGAAGDITVYNAPAEMAWGIPGAAASIVAGPSDGRATLFTYEAGAAMVGGNAPARRAGFFMNATGPANATGDGMTLLQNTILWALGREGDIASNVGIETREGAVPEGFVLGANYPNPFNPATVIPFGLPVAGDVRLTVYNMLGQEVGVLVDAALPAGRYTADFNAVGLPSGVYLYKLQAGATVVSRRMLLMK